MNSQLFSPLVIRELKLKNRIVVSPMCQYSAKDGVPNDWHFVHLGSRATGGAAVVICEATGVSPEGRISPGDTGIWNDEQVTSFARINDFIKSQNAIPGIQIAHAGRKASDRVPWDSSTHTLTPREGGWIPLAPSAIAFSEKSPLPKEMSEKEISLVLEQFIAATENALRAGFLIAEIHMAHGYLLNEFLSPLTNQREDQYGGSLENRMRFPLQVAKEVRKRWPQHLPIFCRISATDWVEGGWTLEDSIVFCKELKAVGIDLIDCSSGGNSTKAKIIVKPGYQIPLSEAIRRNASVSTGAVGMITDPEQAEDILREGQADLIFLARELLRNPYWPLHAAKKLGHDLPWPVQYARAKN